MGSTSQRLDLTFNGFNWSSNLAVDGSLLQRHPRHHRQLLEVYGRNDSGTEQVYDNKGVSYGSGVFTVTLGDRALSAVIITRPDFNILTLCERLTLSMCPDGRYSDDCMALRATKSPERVSVGVHRAGSETKR
ncbi:hypothetical protein DPMN_074528 [Dreissena polymorpha]|uniref:Uncharacterized protein n=1 Tax=Dreissena polymorpha TaxID=45954 RepID=A0A9D4BLS4_DREPO|nr:hypothetical protein DPMN_074528 [Dreissena polymorpha]